MNIGLKSINIELPSGYLYNIAMEAMAHRNRWFTVNSMVISHGYVKQPAGKLDNSFWAPTMPITIWASPPGSKVQRLLHFAAPFFEF